MHIKNLLISAESSGVAGGAGTLSSELQGENTFDTYLFKRFFGKHLNYIFNIVVLFFLIILRNRKSRIILFDAGASLPCGLICVVLRRDFVVCQHGSEIVEFIEQPSRIKKVFASGAVYQLILRRAKNVVVPSQAQRAKNALYIDTKKIMVLPWGASFGTATSDFLLSGHVKKFAVFSRLRSGKGVVELIKECGVSLEANSALAIFGRGPLEDEVKQLCATMDNVFYCGYINNSGVHDVISLLSAVIAPSTLIEAYGLSLRDAIIGKTSCIASVAGAHKEFDGFEGIVLCQNPAEIVGAMNANSTERPLSQAQRQMITQRLKLIGELSYNSSAALTYAG